VKLKRPTIEIQAVELRRRGDKAEMLVKVDDVWRLVADEYLDSNFGHTVYPAGIHNAPLDPIGDPDGL
jgi:hypothetical protein